MLGAVKHKAGGLVNRQGPGAGGGIGNLTGMDGESFRLELTFRHGGVLCVEL